MAAQSNYTVLVDMLIRHQRLEQLRIDPKLNFPYSPDLVLDTEQLEGQANEAFVAEQEEAIGGELMEGERELPLDKFKLDVYNEVRGMRDSEAFELELSTAERLRELVASSNRIYQMRLAEDAKNARFSEQFKNMLAFVGFGGEKKKTDEEIAAEEAAAQAAVLAAAAEFEAKSGRRTSKSALGQPALGSPGAASPGTGSPSHFTVAAETGEPIPVELMPEEAGAPEDFEIPKNVWPTNPPPDETIEAAKENEAYAIDPEKIVLSEIKDEDIEHMHLISTTREQLLIKEEVQHKLQTRDPLDAKINLLATAGGEDGLRVHVIEITNTVQDEAFSEDRIANYLKELEDERIEESKNTARLSSALFYSC